MAHSYTTPDGHEITVYSTCHYDWGLQICNPEGEAIFDCPAYIENSSCGWKLPEGYEGEWDEYEGEMEEWSEEEWQEYLKDEAETLMDGALPWDYEYSPEAEYLEKLTNG